MGDDLEEDGSTIFEDGPVVLEDGTEVIVSAAESGEDEGVDLSGIGAIDSLAQYAVMAEQIADLSGKERIFFKALVAGKTEMEAARIAGYSSVTAAVRAFRSKVSTSGVNMMSLATAGVTPARAAQKLARLMDAKQTKFFASKGIVYDERDVDDNKVQLEATQTYFKLAGLEPASKQKIEMSVSQVPQIPDTILEMSDEELLLTLQRRQFAINSGGG